MCSDCALLDPGYFPFFVGFAAGFGFGLAAAMMFSVWLQHHCRCGRDNNDYDVYVNEESTKSATISLIAQRMIVGSPCTLSTSKHWTPSGARSM